MDRYWIPIGAALVIVLAVLALRFGTGNQSPAPEPKNGQETVQEGERKEEGSQDGETSEKPSEGEQKEERATAENDSIVLFEPAPNTLVPSPFVVRGKARNIPNNELRVRVVGKDGTVFIDQKAKVGGDDKDAFGEFRIGNMWYTFTHGEEKNLEIFGVDAEGKEVAKLVVPLRFQLTGSEGEKKDTVE